MARPKKNVEITEKPARIPEVNKAWLMLKIGNFKGEDSLIVNSIRNKELNWGDKSLPGNRTKAKEIKSPEEEYENSLYRMPNNPGVYGLPASGFKKAMATAANILRTQGVNISAAEVKRTLTVAEDPDGGGYVQLHGDPPNMREDIVSIPSKGKKVPVKRYRAEFKKWYVMLRIAYDADSFGVQDVINLCARAGTSIGWGELRPEKGYSHGMWSIDTNAVSVPKKGSKRGSK